MGIPLLLGVIWAGLPWLTLLVLFASLAGALEFYRLASRRGARPWAFSGVLWTLALVLNGQLQGALTLWVVGVGLGASLLQLLARVLWGKGVRGPLTPVLDWAYTVAGAFYIGWPLSHALLLRGMVGGEAWLALSLLTTFAVDSAAFFAGQALGKRPLAPRISPGKTWEGALGGLLGGMAACLGLSGVLGLPLSPAQALILGSLIALFAQVGDLVESLIKRGARAKDSGRLIPGHGGMLDRLDSIVFTLPIVYYVLRWTGKV